MFHVVCLSGLKVFGGQNENPCREPSIKSPSYLIMFFPVSSVSSTIKVRLLQKLRELNIWVERVLRKGKKVVQSCDHASKNLVFVQSYNSSQVLWHYVSRPLPHYCVKLHVVKILPSNEIESPNKSFHNQ